MPKKKGNEKTGQKIEQPHTSEQEKGGMQEDIDRNHQEHALRSPPHPPVSQPTTQEVVLPDQRQPILRDRPPNSSQAQDRPLGAILESASNFEILGGNFYTTGHVTHGVNVEKVEIHVHQAHREEHETHHKPSLATHSLSSLRIPKQYPGSPTTQSSSRDQHLSQSMYELSEKLNNVYMQPSSPRSPAVHLLNSNKIYERHLGLKQRGFPLRIPEPSRSLPMPYRRQGVNIGDVGIITPSGGFSFLFNIRLPRGDPRNPKILPENFAPIDPPIDPDDIYECSEFKAVSHLASASIEKTRNDPPFLGLSFTISSYEGALLTLPDGAIAQDLENVRRFREYAEANIKSWYHYANGLRGREARNGEIRLVIGCDKATCWGMASVANISQHETRQLKYRFLGDPKGTSAPIPLYDWDYTGSWDAKVGPDLSEIEELKRNDNSDMTKGGKYRNQCLFVRTLNITLSDAAFAEICRDLKLNLVSSRPQSRGSSTAAISHPADVLNNLLLDKVPKSRVVITQDEDWYSVINENDEIMPNSSEIAERVLAANNYKEEAGVVFLEPKTERHSLRHSQRSSNSSTKNISDSPSSNCRISFTASECESGLYPNSRTSTLDTISSSLSSHSFSSLNGSTLFTSSDRESVSSHKHRTSSLDSRSLASLSSPMLPVEGDLFKNINSQDIIIGVMGPSGTGKSSFINTLFGSEVAVASGGLLSCTQEVRAFDCFRPGQSDQKIVVVDTPGFDDTQRTDYDVLEGIASWLERTYSKDIKLSGILHFHNIQESKMRGTTQRHLGMFERLCGPKAMKNVVLLTTFWDELEHKDIGSAREKQLSELFWKSLIDEGSRIERFEHRSSERAWEIINRFPPATAIPLAIQVEMGDEHKKLWQTSSFQFLVQWWTQIVTAIRGPIQGSSQMDPETNHALRQKLALVLKIPSFASSFDLNSKWFGYLKKKEKKGRDLGSINAKANPSA